MGSWAETCLITQMPIEYGDKVRAFILVEQQSWRFENGKRAGGGTCHTTDLWAALGPGIQGKYDDHGGIDHIVEDNDTNLLLSRIKENWITFTEKYDEVSPIESMTLSEALRWIERDKAKFKDRGKDKSLGIAFVLEDIYQAMISFNPIETHDYNKGGYKYMPYHETLKYEFEEHYQNLLTLTNMSQDDQFDFMFEFSDTSYFGHYEKLGLNQYRHALTNCAKQHLPIESSEVQEIYKSTSDMLKFQYSMSRARKMWHPQCGKGSQDNELDIYRIITGASLNIINYRNKKQQEEYDNGRDEQGYYSWMLEHNANFILSDIYPE